ncbi:MULTISPECIES: nuclear transport factor 2 family protein [unclassified Microbacterium]|uniref:nuclear transport factor 2 family protein n=1 Tax=unclassified Microbacterium TaxID=2609290 RepID=UPI001AD5E15C|nr:MULTISPECIES: nuclear transport factor 2 family protein [unclassified Microbacterium]MBN9225426.1 nuclear transport factor 2 family protein [Microbacterium sp.]
MPRGRPTTRRRPRGSTGPGRGLRPLRRALADGDIVVTHSHFRRTPEDRGLAVADFWRLEDGKIVEHWDVIQEVPAEAKNTNSMF